MLDSVLEVQAVSEELYLVCAACNDRCCILETRSRKEIRHTVGEPRTMGVVAG